MKDGHLTIDQLVAVARLELADKSESEDPCEHYRREIRKAQDAMRTTVFGMSHMIEAKYQDSETMSATDDAIIEELRQISELLDGPEEDLSCLLVPSAKGKMTSADFLKTERGQAMLAWLD